MINSAKTGKPDRTLTPHLAGMQVLNLTAVDSPVVMMLTTVTFLNLYLVAAFSQGKVNASAVIIRPVVKTIMQKCLSIWKTPLAVHPAALRCNHLSWTTLAMWLTNNEP